MKAECIECGKTPSTDEWENYDYIEGDFYCASHSPNSDNWCRLCERTNIETEEHHLIPKSKGGQRTVPVCSSCHRRIHSLFTNTELAKKLNTIERIRKMPEIQNYIGWIKKTDKRNVCFKESKRKKMKKAGKRIEYDELEVNI